MELVYLWVEEYKNIKRQGFNFSPRFRCEYDEEKNKLNIEEKKDYVNIFPENINVTAIVGENGSGKSSILELLYIQTSENGIKHDVKLGSNFFYIINKNHNSSVVSLEFYGINKEDAEYKFNDKKIKVLHNFGKESFPDKKSENIIFFTPVLDNTFDLNENLNNLSLNLSLANLLRKSISEIEDYNLGVKTNFYTLYDAYNTNQILYAMNFIKSEPDFELPFELPKYLHIRVKGIYEEDKKWLEIKDGNFTFLDTVEAKLCIDFIKNNNLYLDENKEIEEFVKNGDYEEVINKGKKRLIDFLKIKELNEKADKKAVEKISYKELYDVISKENNFTDAKDFVKKIIEIKKNSEEREKELFVSLESVGEDFFKSYIGILTSYSDILGFSWGIDLDGEKRVLDLSSGQKTLLYQFGQFHKAYYDNRDIKKIFCIDEGETTLHPNWQKKYVYYLNEFFKKKEVHLILSSHSPFILSDIPKENCIFLNKYDEKESKRKYLDLKDSFLEKKLKNGDCINVSSSKYLDINPFGANIHTLLSHGFFMEDGLMGEFAKGKINKIIRFLSNENKFIDLSEIIKAPLLMQKNFFEMNLKPLIEIIGENFLKEKMLKMFDKKFPKSNEEKILELEAEIKRLKNA